MRIVGHQRVAGRRQLRADHPVVRAVVGVQPAIVAEVAHHRPIRAQQRQQISVADRRERGADRLQRREVAGEGVGRIHRLEDLQVARDPLACRALHVARHVELQGARRVERGARDLGIGVVAELKADQPPDQDRVRLGPRRDGHRIVGEQQRGRQRVAPALQIGDERVHAGGVAVQRRDQQLGVGIAGELQRREGVLGGLAQVVDAHPHVAIDDARVEIAGDLRQRACRRAARQIGLDEPIHAHEIGLRIGHVLERRSIDMRDPLLIAHHVHVRREAGRDPHVGLGHRFDRGRRAGQRNKCPERER